ncbi:LPXTG cell wall anchor domain-containing protein [Melissococcus sp. OM08-11BH]|nr:LPXTG cell wall anchor domain-containing protein [Melissococcus sp. OM08-11BH]
MENPTDITVNIKAVTTSNSSSEKPRNPNKTLLKTSDSHSQSLILLGASTIITSVGTFILRRKLV